MWCVRAISVPCCNMSDLASAPVSSWSSSTRLEKGNMRVAVSHFILPVASAGGGAKVIFQEAIAAQSFWFDTWIINCEEHRDSFLAAYGDIGLPVEFAPAAFMVDFVAERARSLKT